MHFIVSFFHNWKSASFISSQSWILAFCPNLGKYRTKKACYLQGCSCLHVTADLKVFLSVKNMGLKYLMHLYNSQKNFFRKIASITNFEALQRGAKDNWVYEVLPFSPRAQDINWFYIKDKLENLPIRIRGTFTIKSNI